MSDIISDLDALMEGYIRIKFIYSHDVDKGLKDSFCCKEKYNIYTTLIYYLSQIPDAAGTSIQTQVRPNDNSYVSNGIIYAETPQQRKEMIDDLLDWCDERNMEKIIDSCFLQVSEDNGVFSYSQHNKRGIPLHHFPVRGNREAQVDGLIKLRRFIIVNFEKYDTDFLVVFFKGRERQSRYMVFRKENLDGTIDMLSRKITGLQNDKQTHDARFDESKKLNFVGAVMFMISQMAVKNKIKILHVTETGDTVSRSFTKEHYYDVFRCLLERFTSLLRGELKNDFFTLLFYHEDKPQVVQTIRLYKDKCSENDIIHLREAMQYVPKYDYELDYIIDQATRTLF